MKKRHHGKRSAASSKTKARSPSNGKNKSTSPMLLAKSQVRTATTRIRLAIVACAACLLGPIASSFSDGAPATNPNEYHLAAQDKVRIRAFEWRASRDEVFEWTAMNSEYAVSAAGTISLPLLGDVVAANQTPHQLAAEIGRGLKTRIGLAESPDVSVEVVQYRPFYIIGDVDKPGEYPYRPGITLLQAVSLAGGDRRDQDRLGGRQEREVIIASGDLSLLEHEVASYRSRKARLEAELANANTISFPDELRYSQSRSTGLVMEQEKLIFDARRESYRNSLNATVQLKDYLEKEITSLEKQIETQDTQLKLANEELSGILTLYQRGLSVIPRKLALQREVAQLQGDRLRLEASVIKTKQDLSAASLAIIELNNKRLNEITTDLRSTQASLEEALRKSGTARDLISESSRLTRPVLGNAEKPLFKAVYSIVRGSGSARVEIAGEESSVLEAGDTVKVALRRAEEAAPLSANAPGTSGAADQVASDAHPAAPADKQSEKSETQLKREQSARAGF